MLKICRLEFSRLFAVVIVIFFTHSRSTLSLQRPSSSNSNSYWTADNYMPSYVSSYTQQHQHHHHHQQQIVIEHPSDQQAKLGDKVLLKCRIRNLRGEPQWCIDDFCLGVAKSATNRTVDMNGSHQNYEQHLKGRPRYRIVGERARGEFNLLIEPVQLQDNMFFYCMATAASETVKAVKSRKAFLTVLSMSFTNLLNILKNS